MIRSRVVVEFQATIDSDGREHNPWTKVSDADYEAAIQHTVGVAMSMGEDLKHRPPVWIPDFWKWGTHSPLPDKRIIVFGWYVQPAAEIGI